MSLINWQAFFDAKACAQTEFRDFAIHSGLLVLVERDGQLVCVLKRVLLLADRQKMLINLEFWEPVGLVWCHFDVHTVLIKLRFVLLQNPCQRGADWRPDTVQVQKILMQQRKYVWYLHVRVLPEKLENLTFEEVSKVFLSQNRLVSATPAHVHYRDLPDGKRFEFLEF